MPRDRRGQMLLVAALGLAVAFVALALVLNAVVFTENLATRNPDPADDALAYEGAVEGGAGGLVAGVNDAAATDYGSLRAALGDAVAVWDRNATRLAVADGSVTRAGLAGVENGTQVLQSEAGQYTDASGDPDWRLAADVTGTRRFRAVAEPTSTTPLIVTVDGGAGTWRVEVAENASDPEQTDVTVRRNGTVVATHTHSADTAAVDLTEGTVNGTAVANWTWAAGVEPSYDVTVQNGDAATGRYVAFVDRPRAELLDDLAAGTYHARWEDEYPTTAPALYAADVSLMLQRARLTYATTVTLTPAREPGGEDYAVAADPAARPPGVVFVDDATGDLVWATRTRTTTLDASGVEVLGPLRTDLDGDARLEVPYVDDAGALRVVDTANRTETWRTASSTHPPPGPPSRLATSPDPAAPNGVLYADASGNSAFAATDPNGTSTEQHFSDDGVTAVAGSGDVDGDGVDELVFGDGSQQLRYRDDGGTEVKIPGGGYGKNNGHSIGSPTDFDGDGTARIPFVDGSNNLRLIDGAGNTEELVDATNVTVAKTALAVDDWDGDGALEIVFVAGDGDLWYVDDVAGGGTAVEITADLDGDGTSGANVDTGPGVA